ncbi:MAG TPA: metallophosphoesterase [Phycisphaerales bacterium]|nr:metallophosphoesterase [Phycisphaerales bacterium]
MEHPLTRREVMKSLGGVAAVTVLSGMGAKIAAAGEQVAAATGTAGRAKRSLRVAHITDVHVQPELHAGEGLATCLKSVQSMSDKPDFIINGGDCVFDSFEARDDRAQTQWDLWHSVFKNECGLPVKSCIGNHDIWGWGKRSKATGQETNYGKQRALDNLQIPKRYYSFDGMTSAGKAGGWHVVMLDSVQQHENGYRAYLDDEQRDWLESDLRDNAGKNTLIVSHIPILSSTVFMLGSKQDHADWDIDASLMHTDVLQLKDLFAKNPGVKACLSGHIHLVDRVEYNGVSYLCDGAVCGNWWKGAHHECQEGYAVIDLFDDGTVERTYVPYGWKAQR